jgi:hypothetical protein
MDDEHSFEKKKPKSTTSAGEEPRTMKENATGINIKKKKSVKKTPIQVSPTIHADVMAQLLLLEGTRIQRKTRGRIAAYISSLRMYLTAKQKMTTTPMYGEIFVHHLANGSNQ